MASNPNENGDGDIERGLDASQTASAATSTNTTQLQPDSPRATNANVISAGADCNNQNQQPDAAAIGGIQTTTTTSFLHTIEDDLEELPLPIGMAENISNITEPPKQIGRVELIDEDDVGPTPPIAMLEASFNAVDNVNKMIAASRIQGLELIDGEIDLPSCQSSDFDDSIERKNSKLGTKRVPELVASEEDIPQPPGAYEEMEFNTKMGGLEIVEDGEGPPIPPASAFDDSCEKNKRPTSQPQPQPLPASSNSNTIPVDRHGRPHLHQGNTNNTAATNISLGEKIRRNIQAIYGHRVDESVSGYTHAQMQAISNPINNSDTSGSEAGDADGSS